MDPESPIDGTQAPVKAPNKKVFLIALGSFLALVLFLTITILFPRPAKPQNPAMDVSKENANSHDTVDQSPSPTPEKTNDGKIYQSSEFSMTYPKDWQTQELKFPNGETGVSFHPIVAAASNPSMLVVDITPESAKYSQELQSYVSIGFKRSDMVVDNYQAVKLMGTIPQRTSLTLASQSLIQATHIYLKKGESEYLLKYTYMDKAINPELEKMFGSMLASFKFN